MATEQHRLTIVDCGAEHRHRWRAECACGGWVGVPRRRKKEAAKMYRLHTESRQNPRRAWEQAHNGRRVGYLGKRNMGMLPAECTPVDQLPDALRVK